MKILSILVISLFSWHFSKSQIPREVKEWCLSIKEQNVELIKKNQNKDSIINRQGVLFASREGQIKSYQRDSVSWVKQDSAHRIMFDKHEAFIGTQRKEIRKLKTKNTITFGTLLIAVAIIIKDLFDDD